MFGYLRADDETDDEQIRAMERAFRRLALAEGFCLAITFYEYTPGHHGAFHELADELTRAEAHDVVVPSLGHLSPHPLLRSQLIAQLVCYADAHIWVIEP